MNFARSLIFNVASFETSKNMTIYVVKEINSSEGLYFKANYDMLTKLPNRNLLRFFLNRVICKSIKYAGTIPTSDKTEYLPPI